MTEPRLQTLCIRPRFAVDRECALEVALEHVLGPELNDEDPVGSVGPGSIHNEGARHLAVRVRPSLDTARGSGPAPDSDRTSRRPIDVTPRLAGREARFLGLAGRKLHHVVAIAWMLIEAMNEDGDGQQVVHRDVKLGSLRNPNQRPRRLRLVSFFGERVNINRAARFQTAGAVAALLRFSMPQPLAQF